MVNDPAVEHIGIRIRYWRRRRGGMSQAVLAGLAGLSQPYISQLESGTRSVDRRSTLVAIAKALQVSVADLLGQPGDPTDPNKALATMSVPEIRLALAEIDADVIDAPQRPRDQVVADLAVYDARQLACDFATAAPMLPGLLRDSASYGPALSSEVLRATASLLRSIGYHDLAWRAAGMSVSNARAAESNELLGACQFSRLNCLPPEAYTVIEAQARRTYEELQPHTGDPGARRGYGALHLSAALALAQANRPDLVADHLAEAKEVALTLGEPANPGGLSMAFGPTNVGLWAMASALESGEYRRVVEIAQTVHPENLSKSANRVSTYWLDLGRALSHVPGRDREAVVALARAEALAPQYMRVLPAARNAVAALVGRARQRALAEDLRRLADRMGLGAL
jgi:transcriptional regulator with XRE-family HTH domain